MAMEDSAKLNLAAKLCGIEDMTSTDAALVGSAYLPAARDLILSARHPFSADPTAEGWEARYDMLQCQIAADMFSRRGAEGEVTHNENGVNRTWASAGVSGHLLSQVVPIAKVPNASA